MRRRYTNPNEAKNRAKRAGRLRRARERGRHTPEEWLALVAEFDGRCVRCGTGEGFIDKDHIIPIYQEEYSPSDGVENLQPLCSRCNASKGPDRTNWVEHRRQYGFDDCNG